MPEKSTLEIARRLKTARKAAGYKSAKALAIELGIPVSTYAQHESGARKINSKSILSYSEKLQINPYWILTGKKEANIANPSLDYLLEIDEHSSCQPSEKIRSEYQMIDISLLKKILLSAGTMHDDNEIIISVQELISYCFDIFDIISNLSAGADEKDKIINLTMLSLKRGASKDVKIFHDKIPLVLR